MIYRLSIPAKFMLVGEYSVLDGFTSLSASIDLFMQLEAKILDSDESIISSDIWQTPYIGVLGQDKPSPEKSLLIDALFQACTFYKIKSLDLKVQSGWDISSGFGSSSALRLGLFLICAAIAKGSCNLATHEQWLSAKQAFKQQKKAQGFASGYDIATQLIGGLVSFTTENETWPKLAVCHDDLAKNLSDQVHIFYGGQGSDTKKIGSSTLMWLNQNERKKTLQSLSLNLRQELLLSLQKPTPSTSLFTACSKHRQFFMQSPAYPKELFQGVEALPGLDILWSFKSTGAGGEDAILVFGQKESLFAVEHYLDKKGWKRQLAHFPAQGCYFS